MSVDLNLSETEIHTVYRQTGMRGIAGIGLVIIGNKDLRSGDAQGTFLGIDFWAP